MTRSRNKRTEKRTLRKRTLRKKNKREHKSKRRSKNKGAERRTLRRWARKKTLKKKKVNLQIGGNVEPMMARVLHTLERDIIEYLPSTKVVENLQSEKHYLEMVDYLKLQEIINNNEGFKKSPKIRKLFDYDLYEINNKEMYFVYKDFKCENIFKDVDKYYIYILYFYLMECNITRNDKIQQDGGAAGQPPPLEAGIVAPSPSDPPPLMSPPEQIVTPLDKVDVDRVELQPPLGVDVPRNQEPADNRQRMVDNGDVNIQNNATQLPPQGSLEPAGREGVEDNEGLFGVSKSALALKGEEVVAPPPSFKPEDVDDPPSPLSEPPQGEAENDDPPSPQGEAEDDPPSRAEVEEDENLRLVSEIELPGFQEYEETRQKLDMKSDIVNGDIKVTNSDLIKYKVNWFNVCMGIDTFDTGFENKVNTKLGEIGIKPFKRKNHLEKIGEILDDKEMTSNFKNAIYERLIENCKEPEDFISNVNSCDPRAGEEGGSFDKFLGIFRKCHDKEMKDNGGILYLYDKYKTILNQNKTTINNVDLILIILNCEIRQRILSYHISVEIIRRRNVPSKAITSILENIYEMDRPVIEEVEEELKNKLAQEKIDRIKIIEQVNREEIEMRKKQMFTKQRTSEDELLSDILETKHRDRFNMQSGIESSGVKKHIGNNAGENDDFIGTHRGLLKNNAAAAAGGGSGGSGGSDELNINSDMYDIYNNRTQNEYCNSINDIITKEHMKSGPLLNKCKNF